MTRPAAEVGAGLDPARSARPIRPGERIHVVGAAGAGASGAALLAAAAGARVDGCDTAPDSPYAVAVRAAGIAIVTGHAPEHLDRPLPPDRIAVTKALTAIAPDAPELVAARRRGIPAESWQQVVADAATGRTLVAVAGTHGKSTTAGWLVAVLVEAGLDPAAFVGALMPGSLTGGVPATARRGRGAPFVVEADEYAGNFDAYVPSVAVLTNAEWDHPDVFADRAAVVAAFADWLRRAAGPSAGPDLVVNVADAGVDAVVTSLGDWPGAIVATALVEGGRIRPGILGGLAERYRTETGPARGLVGRIVATDPEGSTVEVDGLDPIVGSIRVRIGLPGRHNAANALTVAGGALALGLPADRIVAGLGRYTGVGRRLERKGQARDVAVYDDYAHHPTAIRATLGALHQREPGRRIWVACEPLTFHRTAAMLDDLAAALAEADGVAVADIWAGRDIDTAGVSAADVAASVAVRNPSIEVDAPGSAERTADWLVARVRAGDVVVAMGGGQSYRIAELVLAGLSDA